MAINSKNHSPVWRPLLLTPLALACFALSPASLAQLPSPTPDGGYPNNNTAEGDGALLSLTSGIDNTAVGFSALRKNTTGNSNVAIGGGALLSNTTGYDNTATGVGALYHNNANSNTADGTDALYFNTSGAGNTALGHAALEQNRGGKNNTATGYLALLMNAASDNTATGSSALQNDTGGTRNTAVGGNALLNNATANNNTAVGYNALYNNTGSGNIALGYEAGYNLTAGSNNIDIGAVGQAAESNTIRIGKGGVQQIAYMQGISGSAIAGTAVVVNSSGRLGVASSSARFKDEIKTMDKLSEAVLALKPVTFHYKKDIDPEGTPQFGLVAEEVEKINPALVTRDAQGKVFTVRYDAVNAMLLNEFLKAHRKVEQQEATIAELEQEMKAVVAQLKAQASQIQKVSAQLELNKPAPQTVANNQ